MGFLLRSVRNWLTLLFLAVVAVAVLTAYLYIVPPLQDRLVSRKLTELTTGARSLDQRVLLPIDPTGQIVTGPDITLQDTAVFFDQQINARIIFVDASTKYALGDSRRSQPFNPANYPMIKSVVETRQPQAGTTTINGTEYAAVAAPVFYPWGNEPEARRRAAHHDLAARRADGGRDREAAAPPGHWRSVSSSRFSQATWPPTSSPGASNASSAAPRPSPPATSRPRSACALPTRSASSASRSTRWARGCAKRSRRSSARRSRSRSS